MRRGFFFGVGATILLLLVGMGIMVTFGLVPANADAKPSGLEAWMARKSLHATLARQAPKGEDGLACDHGRGPGNRHGAQPAEATRVHPSHDERDDPWPGWRARASRRVA